MIDISNRRYIKIQASQCNSFVGKHCVSCLKAEVIEINSDFNLQRTVHLTDNTRKAKEIGMKYEVFIRFSTLRRRILHCNPKSPDELLDIQLHIDLHLKE